jgi:hypothetical protein
MAACTPVTQEMIRMIRVTKSERRGRTIITIDGQLSGDYIEVVETCYKQAVLEGRPVDVFLHDVLTIDKSGRALLTRLVAKGIRLLATGIYTSHVVRGLVATSSRPSGSPSGGDDAGRKTTSSKSEPGYG